jgi:glycerol-3-phosphate acyltransferase PlsX
MDDNPSLAFRSKPKASIFVCWQLLSAGKVDGLISAGNTGAVVAGGFAGRRFLKGIQRPGIAVTMPSPKGWSVMIDVGANVAPKPEHLFQYGVMGRIFAKQILNSVDPKIGLLNIGSEEAKGNSLAKSTSQLFINSPLKQAFVGNVEGRDVNRGLVDVIVCEGFVGNIVLKCCEGMVDFLMGEVRKEIHNNLSTGKESAEKLMTDLHNRYHYSEFGGAPLLGIDGVCIICHGSSDDKAIRNAAHAAKRFHPINRLIIKEMDETLSAMHVESV